MEQIEEELYRIHAAARKQSDSDHGSASGSNQTGQATQSSDPLGTVTSIDEGSPAERAVSFTEISLVSYWRFAPRFIDYY